MPILDAALAFALTMLVVSTVVTQVVRFFQNTAKLRNTGMQKMLKQYFDKELQPVVERELNRLKKDVGNKVTTQLAQVAKNNANFKVFDNTELSTVVDVSTTEIVERLKRSKLGAELLTHLGDKAQSIFDELGKRYEAVGDIFTASFRDHSRKWATGVALVIALVFNIDSIFIMDSYIKNEGMRQAVIAQRDTFEQDYQDLVAALEKEGDTATKEDVEKAFSDSRNQVTALTNVGFPLGWTYFPHAGFKDGKAEAFTSRANMGGWLMWLLGILLTAGLAGLGAPFWFDVVSGIARVVESARSSRKSPQK